MGYNKDLKKKKIIAHCYADDTQLYVPFAPGIDEEEVWVRIIHLFFTYGANLLPMVKNKSQVFANLAKEFDDKDSQPKCQKR